MSSSYKEHDSYIREVHVADDKELSVIYKHKEDGRRYIAKLGKENFGKYQYPSGELDDDEFIGYLSSGGDSDTYEILDDPNGVMELCIDVDICRRGCVSETITLCITLYLDEDDLFKEFFRRKIDRLSEELENAKESIEELKVSIDILTKKLETALVLIKVE